MATDSVSSKFLVANLGTWKCGQEPRPNPPTEKWTGNIKSSKPSKHTMDNNQIVHICKCEYAEEMWK